MGNETEVLRILQSVEECIFVIAVSIAALAFIQFFRWIADK